MRWCLFLLGRCLRKTETDALTDTKLKRGRLEALKTVELVKVIEPSLAAWEADNERPDGTAWGASC